MRSVNLYLEADYRISNTQYSPNTQAYTIPLPEKSKTYMEKNILRTTPLTRSVNATLGFAVQDAVKKVMNFRFNKNDNKE